MKAEAAPKRFIAWSSNRVQDINSHFRKDNLTKGIRKDSEALLEACLADLNEVLKTEPTREEFADALSEFWINFVYAIRPFEADNEKTAKFVIRSEIQRLGYQLFETNIFDEFQMSADAEEGLARLSEEVLENLVSLKEDMPPSF